MTNSIADHSAITRQVHDLSQEIQKILGDNLLGIYLYGSLVWGDFANSMSDIDVMIVTKTNLTDDEVKQLDTTHQELSNKYSKENNRIDIFYISQNTLHSLQLGEDIVYVFFPGKPLHTKLLNTDDLMNVYFTQEKSEIIYGSQLPRYISSERFIKLVKAYTKAWRGHMAKTSHTRENQAYIILTMCRALYAVSTFQQTSKVKAAAWAKERFPQWSPFIDNAIKWRENWENEQIVDEEMFAKTGHFVDFVIDFVTCH